MIADGSGVAVATSVAPVDVTRPTAVTAVGAALGVATVVAAAASILAAAWLVHRRADAWRTRWLLLAAIASAAQLVALLAEAGAGAAALLGERRGAVVLARLLVVGTAWLLGPAATRATAAGLGAALIATVILDGTGGEGLTDLALVATSVVVLAVGAWVAARPGAGGAAWPGSAVAVTLAAVAALAVVRAGVAAGFSAVFRSPATVAILAATAAAAVVAAAPPPRLRTWAGSLQVAAIALGALLAVTLLPARTEPFTATLRADEAQLVVTLSPSARGENEFHLYVFDAGGAPVSVDEAQVALSPPRGGARPVELWQVGPNHLLAYGVDLPVAGRWRLAVDATAAGRRIESTTTFEVAT